MYVFTQEKERQTRAALAKARIASAALLAQIDEEVRKELQEPGGPVLAPISTGLDIVVVKR